MTLSPEQEQIAKTAWSASELEPGTWYTTWLGAPDVVHVARDGRFLQDVPRDWTPLGRTSRYTLLAHRRDQLDYGFPFEGRYVDRDVILLPVWVEEECFHRLLKWIPDELRRWMPLSGEWNDEVFRFQLGYQNRSGSIRIRFPQCIIANEAGILLIRVEVPAAGYNVYEVYSAGGGPLDASGSLRGLGK
jgi:hypothetical protein